ncbi:hypothetical protein GCM10027435_18340 [Haloparvum alkalitolerans]
MFAEFLSMIILVAFWIFGVYYIYLSNKGTVWEPLDKAVVVSGKVVYYILLSALILVMSPITVILLPFLYALSISWDDINWYG